MTRQVVAVLPGEWTELGERCWLIIRPDELNVGRAQLVDVEVDVQGVVIEVLINAFLPGVCLAACPPRAPLEVEIRTRDLRERTET